MAAPPPEIQELIEKHIEAFNANDAALFHGVFGDTAIIIDGIAPYRWLNPNAPAKWLTDVQKWRDGLGVIREHFEYKLTFWVVEGDYAYAVISGKLNVTMKSQTVTTSGNLAYTFSKDDGKWKIDAQAWGRTS